MRDNPNTFLFSVDLEDVRMMVPDGHKYAERVPETTYRYLNFLQKHSAKATFFVVGDLARKYPELIKEIERSGHEIACHSDKHIPLTELTRDQFSRDLENNLEAIHKTGVSDVYGYRAPTFSINHKVMFVYDIMSEFGINYSSSVLPAKNPLHGWKEFGRQPKKVGNVIEIPITTSKLSLLDVPYAGGVYFRVLPFFLIKWLCKRERGPINSYCHPYDVDDQQEKFMHPAINNNTFYNELLFFNRKNTIKRFDRLIDTLDLKIQTYHSYSKRLKSDGI
ncbi:polysaccharide deacetylase family protein [Flavobacteriales bacterium]|nr:polysaccharide deacetylase family protein [Flavobacteriales bacterium]